MITWRITWRHPCLCSEKRCHILLPSVSQPPSPGLACTGNSGSMSWAPKDGRSWESWSNLSLRKYYSGLGSVSEFPADGGREYGDEYIGQRLLVPLHATLASLFLSKKPPWKERKLVLNFLFHVCWPLSCPCPTPRHPHSLPALPSTPDSFFSAPFPAWGCFSELI